MRVITRYSCSLFCKITLHLQCAICLRDKVSLHQNRDASVHPGNFQAIFFSFCFQFFFQAILMDLVDDDKARGLETPVWSTYKKYINEAEGKEVSLILSSSQKGIAFLSQGN